MTACLLLAVAVLGCDPAAQAYAPSAARVPAQHWALVRSVAITEGDHGRATHGGVLHLPLPARPGVLLHEVGHIVSYQDDGSLLDGWYATFWRGGRPHGRLPSRYARHGVAEDFAESYRRLLQGTLGACCPGRAVWLCDAVPELGAACRNGTAASAPR